MGRIGKTFALLLTLIIALSCLPLLSIKYVSAQTATPQTPTLEWSKTYTRNLTSDAVTAQDRGFVVTQTNDGGYAVIGSLDDHRFVPHTGGVDNSSVVFMKTDYLGSIQWKKTDLPISVYPYCFVLQTKDLGFLVSGNDSVVKLDLEGNVQWKKNYGCNVGYITETSDGNYVSLGSAPFSALTGIGYLLKIDNQGNLLWKNLLPTSENFQIFSVIEIDNKTYAACGRTGNSAWFGMIDSNGNLAMNQSYLEIAGYFSSMTRSKNGTFVAVGGTWQGGIDNQQEGLVAAIDLSGQLVWNHTFVNQPYESFVFSSLADIANGYYVAAGSSGLFGLDINGSLFWNISGDGVGGSVSKVISSNVGSFVVVGNTATSIWLAKFSSQTPTPTPSLPPSDRNAPHVDPIIYLIPVSVMVAVVVLSILLYRRHRKNPKPNTPNQ